MPRITHWERHIGRRLRLRDLFVFFTVVDSGSMAKAAKKLGVSTPSVSALLADVEHALGVRLLDRTPKGVVPTVFGKAILTRGRAAFDELQQGIRDIEFLADPSAGEVRIACPESSAAFLAVVVERVAERHPGMRFQVQVVSRAPDTQFPELRDRTVDFRLSRLTGLPEGGRLGEDFRAEVLFDDPFSVLVGEGSKWAGRRKVDIAELVNEPWICTSHDAAAALFVAEAFKRRGLAPPKPRLETFSIHLRSILAGTGKYIAVLPRSFLRAGATQHRLKELPIQLSAEPSPVAAVMLRDRTLTPAVNVVITMAKEVARTFQAKS